MSESTLRLWVPLFLATCMAASATEVFTYVPARSPAAAFSVMVSAHGKRCTGVLIAVDVVLTAAHCLGPQKVDPHQVRISFPTLLPMGESRSRWACEAQRIAFNPLWADARVSGQQAAFDVGLLQFGCPLPPRARPISTDYAKAHSATGTDGLPVSVVGFGNLVDEREPLGNGRAVEVSDPRLKLRAVDIRVPDILDAPALITLQGSAGFICHGDSGGAVYSETLDVDRDLLFGVNSQTGYGQGCTTTSFVARLDSSYDWIRQTMIGFGSPSPLPRRPDDADACAKIAVVPNANTDTPDVEVTASNVCEVRIQCSVVGWTVLSSGWMSHFKKSVLLDPDGIQVLKIYTHRTTPAYAVAICDQD